MLIAVGGHSRDVGKTSVVCGIIAATPQAQWQAIKITQFGHNVCATDGDACGCVPEDPSHPYAIDEQLSADSTDSGRYLAAGAARSLWLRTAKGELGHAIPALRKLLAQSQNTIVESNSILQFFQPDLYVVVLDYGNKDLKDSSRLYMDRAGAFVINTRGMASPPWPGIPERWLAAKPTFPASEGHYVAPELEGFVRQRLQCLTQ